MGRSNVVVGGCHDGLGSMEGNIDVPLEEDMCTQRKARQSSRMGGRWVGWRQWIASSKARAVQ